MTAAAAAAFAVGCWWLSGSLLLGAFAGLAVIFGRMAYR